MGYNKQTFRLAAKDSRGNAIDLPARMTCFYGPSLDEVRYVARGIVIGLHAKYKKPRVEIWDADTDALILIQQ